LNEKINIVLENIRTNAWLIGEESEGEEI